MTIPLVDLQAQHRALRPEIDAAMQRVIERGDFILGQAVGDFEKAFAAFIGTAHCIGVASGTDALFLTLKCLGIGPGDKVLVPANTFIATALAVTYAGATPVLADVDPHTYTLDVARAKLLLPAGLKAIMPVHLYGQPADMSAVLDLAREKGLPVIEDAAQAHGAAHRLGSCGRLGIAAGFSFYPAKNLGALGDGGAICTSDDALAAKLRLARNWGSVVKYRHEIQGFNSRLDTLQAAVLAVKLAHLRDWNERRQQVAGWYRDELQDLNQEIALPVEAPATVAHVYHLFVIQLRRADRDRVLKDLRTHGVEAGIHYPVPIHLQEAYRELGQGPGAFPVTEACAGRILSLPLYPEMTRAMVKTVGAALRQVLKV